MALGDVDARMDEDETKRLQSAAEIIAREARSISSTFSKRIPLATRVVTDHDGKVSVFTSGTDAPNAAPFELPERHPLFGDKEHWYEQPHRPYMEEAGDRKADAAAEEYANVCDDWAKTLGWRTG